MLQLVLFKSKMMQTNLMLNYTHKNIQMYCNVLAFWLFFSQSHFFTRLLYTTYILVWKSTSLFLDLWFEIILAVNNLWFMGDQ